MKIPNATKALNKEWNKLQNELKAWDLSTVCERSEVIKRCEKSGKKCHFGSLMTLCHEKHSELNRPPEQRVLEVWRLRRVGAWKVVYYT